MRKQGTFGGSAFHQSDESATSSSIHAIMEILPKFERLDSQQLPIGIDLFSGKARRL
jgi:hypothetical protein